MCICGIWAICVCMGRVCVCVWIPALFLPLSYPSVWGTCMYMCAAYMCSVFMCGVLFYVQACSMYVYSMASSLICYLGQHSTEVLRLCPVVQWAASIPKCSPTLCLSPWTRKMLQGLQQPPQICPDIIILGGQSVWENISKMSHFFHNEWCLLNVVRSVSSCMTLCVHIFGRREDGFIFVCKFRAKVS
jgi:hypothetical protein